jgi:hypothetical protein
MQHGPGRLHAMGDQPSRNNAKENLMGKAQNQYDQQETGFICALDDAQDKRAAQTPQARSDRRADDARTLASVAQIFSTRR